MEMQRQEEPEVMAKDACYHEAKRKYSTFPSARASQYISKCRKRRGTSKKSKKGASLKRWEAEKWTDTKTGKPCGAKTKGAQYCRPTKRVSSKTPKTAGELTAAQKRTGQRAKAAGKRAPAQRYK
jgi:hypothetical protein